jgi:hypothetical protein
VQNRPGKRTFFRRSAPDALLLGNVHLSMGDWRSRWHWSSDAASHEERSRLYKSQERGSGFRNRTPQATAIMNQPKFFSNTLPFTPV